MGWTKGTKVCCLGTLGCWAGSSGPGDFYLLIWEQLLAVPTPAAHMFLNFPVHTLMSGSEQISRPTSAAPTWQGSAFISFRTAPQIWKPFKTPHKSHKPTLTPPSPKEVAVANRATSCEKQGAGHKQGAEDHLFHNRKAGQGLLPALEQTSASSV